MLSIKDIIKNIDNVNVKLSEIDNKVMFVPESMPINDVLKVMKKQRQQMVIVVGEYGGTEGLVTFEDVIEELMKLKMNMILKKVIFLNARLALL